MTGIRHGQITKRSAAAVARSSAVDIDMRHAGTTVKPGLPQAHALDAFALDNVPTPLQPTAAPQHPLRVHAVSGKRRVALACNHQEWCKQQ